MAIDYSVINSTNAPLRARRIAKYLFENDSAQLAVLDPTSNTYYNWFYQKDFSTENVPDVTITLVSKNLTTITLGCEDLSGDVTSWDADHSDKVWDGTAPANPTATTTFTVTAGEGTYTWGDTVPGHHKIIGVDATDAQGESTTKFVEAIYQPDLPTTIAAANGTGSSVVTWTDAAGAASHMMYWKDGSLSHTAAQILAAPTGSEAATTPAGQTITLAANTYSFTITATNPAGTSLGGTANGATVS